MAQVLTILRIALHIHCRGLTGVINAPQLGSVSGWTGQPMEGSRFDAPRPSGPRARSSLWASRIAAHQSPLPLPARGRTRDRSGAAQVHAQTTTDTNTNELIIICNNKLKDATKTHERTDKTKPKQAELCCGGGLELEIVLTDDTFAPSVGLTDAASDALVAGLRALSDEPAGWNAVLQPALLSGGAGGVSRPHGSWHGELVLPTAEEPSGPPAVPPRGVEPRTLPTIRPTGRPGQRLFSNRK